MARDFGVSAPSMSIALTSYLLSLAIFIPASGLIADRFGSRTVFRSAILVFLAGSIFCALSPNLLCLVLARLLQGLGGAMMLPVGRLVLLRSVARKDMVNAMSWLLVPALIGPILGPPVGGMIVTYLDWRWIFWFRFSSMRPRARRAVPSTRSASSFPAYRSARCCSASKCPAAKARARFPFFSSPWACSSASAICATPVAIRRRSWIFR
jgi:MFS family permease